MYKFLCGHRFPFLSVTYLEVELLSHMIAICSFLKNFGTFFHRGCTSCTVLHSYQQSMKVLISPHPHQQLLFVYRYPSLQYSRLENPMGGGAWWAAVHGVAKSLTWLSDFTSFHFSLSCTGEGNGNPLQYSCLENPRDGGAWWAAVYRVAQSWTRLKRLSSSSSIDTLVSVKYLILWFWFIFPLC